MFSIFDYFRRRTCDSFLAGAYDALEILESEKALTLVDPAEVADGKKAVENHSLSQPAPAPERAREPLKIVAPQRPLPAPAPKKTPPPAQQHTPKAPAPTPAGKPPPAPSEKMSSIPVQAAPNRPPAQKTSAPPPPDLFNVDAGEEKPLPPRKRGRPRKYPPGGTAQ